jgi:hypothetical protein
MGRKRVLGVVWIGVSLSLLCAVGAQTAFAAPPAGTYDVTVGGASELWLPDGPDQLCDTENGDTICVSTLSAADATGAVTGTGELDIHFVDLLDANMPVTFAGQLGGSTKSPTAKLEAEGSAPAVLHGTDIGDIAGTLSGTTKVTCKNPFPHTAEFQCKGRLRLCFSALGITRCSSGPMFMTLAAVGGEWTLHLDLATDELGDVTGTASATLANEASADYSVTGKYNARTDQSKLAVVPLDPLAKDKLGLSKLVVDALVESGALKFKVAGVKGAAIILPPP